MMAIIIIVVDRPIIIVRQRSFRAGTDNVKGTPFLPPVKTLKTDTSSPETCEPTVPCVLVEIPALISMLRLTDATSMVGGGGATSSSMEDVEASQCRDGL
mmetsp:Transcript_29318/g.41508  ORF Transcript_29318/g.41508 Transcript_29318/m.41508 type:complete len:100 (-) Transcript_29318:453-752(-)